MGVQVTFDYNAWIQRYPEFHQNVGIELAQDYFNEATIYHRNDGVGPPTNPQVQLMLLNMITAHVAQMYAADAQSGQSASSIVGRITSAGEGSVNVSAEMTGPDAAQWWYQTKYGASYWNATKQYRTMRYKAGFVRPINPFPYSRRFGGGW